MKKYTAKKPLEHVEQKLVIAYLKRAYPKLKGCYWATPNGAMLKGNALQRARQTSKLKAEGMLNGVADLSIMVARGKYHGLFIEMKRSGATASSLSTYQKDFLKRMKKNGYAAEWCAGHEEAIKVLDKYLKLK